jgi:antitoxin VapB
MSLNIKNPRVHELARQAARATGRTQTSAIEEALVLLLKEYDADPATAEREEKLTRLREIGEWFLKREPPLAEQDGAIRTIDELYDDATGLPR